ncbi:MAG: hypothetical protein GYB68_13010 [Chloroflexi bacterium]|nr:hypothetical protein [Chloroflexota bacterium]
MNRSTKSPHVSFWGIALFLNLLVVAALAGSQLQVRAADNSLSGWLNVVHMHRSEPGPNAYEIRLSLTLPDGERVQLNLPEGVLEEAGGATVLAGEWVTVDRTPGAESITLAALPADLDEPISKDLNLGDPWLSLICRHATAPNQELESVSYFDNMYSGDTGLVEYYEQASFGAVDISGSASAGEYVVEGISLSPTFNNMDRFEEACIRLAEPEVDFSQYYGINIMTNWDPQNSAFGGLLTLEIDGRMRTIGRTFNPPFSWGSVGVVAHEMGHGYGMPHSNNSDPATVNWTYDSPYDVMSWGGLGPYGILDPIYGELGQNFITWQTERVGWIDSSRVQNVSSGTYELQQIARPNGEGELMLIVPSSSSSIDYYTVEARFQTGFDVNLPNPEAAIIIHEVVEDRQEPAWLVPNFANEDPYIEGAYWSPGETFEGDGATIIIHDFLPSERGLLVSVNQPSESIPGSNAMQNYSFETPLGTEWVEGADNNNDLRLPTALAQNGDNVLLFRPPSSGIEFYAQTVNVSGQSGDQYRLAFQMAYQSVAAGTRAGARVELFDGDALIGSQTCPVDISGNGNWRTVTCEITATAAYDSITVSIGWLPASDSQGLLGIDTVYLQLYQ